ncbi:DoxX family protein [Parapedobacter sp. GCM10030251]|uniref:DoxX family protein n=1 Tax=Parapedobacter sp. GCM10030251 TaxID=3273419 RepID=UPI0036079ECC
MNKQRLIELFLRLPIAMSFLGHGLVRLPKLEAFASDMADQFTGTVLPHSFVFAFGYVLVFVEFIAGVWLISGRWFQQALFTGLAIMTILIFGSALVENWTAVSAQLIHSIYLSGLLLLAVRRDIATNIRTAN